MRNGGAIFAGGPPMDGFLFSAGVIVPANSVLVFSRDRGDQRNAATFTGREAMSGECNSGLLLGSRHPPADELAVSVLVQPPGVSRGRFSRLKRSTPP